MTAKRISRAALILVLGAATAESGPPDSTLPDLTILLNDAVGIPEPHLRDAENVVREVFAHSGIRTNFQRCSMKPTFLAPLPPCGFTEPDRLLVRILPESLSQHLGRKSREAGLALFDFKGLGIRAYVFYDRLNKFSSTHTTNGGVLLGRVMAHELGHLLLTTGSHGGEGIMQPMSGRTLRYRTTVAGAYFTPKETKRIRASLARAADPVNLMAAGRGSK